MYMKKIILKCIDDNCSTKGLTKGKKYELISVENCGGTLYRIIDDNVESHRYSPDFFEKLEKVF